MLQKRSNRKACAEIGECCLTVDRLEVGLENPRAVAVLSAFSGRVAAGAISHRLLSDVPSNHR